MISFMTDVTGIRDDMYIGKSDTGGIKALEERGSARWFQKYNGGKAGLLLLF